MANDPVSLSCPLLRIFSTEDPIRGQKRSLVPIWQITDSTVCWRPYWPSLELSDVHATTYAETRSVSEKSTVEDTTVHSGDKGDKSNANNWSRPRSHTVEATFVLVPPKIILLHQPLPVCLEARAIMAEFTVAFDDTIFTTIVGHDCRSRDYRLSTIDSGNRVVVKSVGLYTLPSS